VTYGCFPGSPHHNDKKQMLGNQCWWWPEVLPVVIELPRAWRRKGTGKAATRTTDTQIHFGRAPRSHILPGIGGECVVSVLGSCVEVAYLPGRGTWADRHKCAAGFTAIRRCSMPIFLQILGLFLWLLARIRLNRASWIGTFVHAMWEGAIHLCLKVVQMAPENHQLDPSTLSFLQVRGVFLFSSSLVLTKKKGTKATHTAKLHSPRNSSPPIQCSMVLPTIVY